MSEQRPIRLVEPYRRRPIRPLGLLAVDGWRVKQYGIAYDRPLPSPGLVAAARSLAPSILPAPAVDDRRYGVGFLGVHEGRDACVVFVDWWSDENELHHRLFVSPTSAPTALVEVGHGAMAGCVWDLAVIAHEREAWVGCVLDRPGGPDLEAYLERWLDTEV